VAQLIRSALQKCVSNAEGLLKREDAAIRAVFEGLVIGGIAFEAGHGVMVSAKKVWNAFTMDKQALEQELAWYEQVREIMDSELG
jgi:hypothetical protein